MPNPEEPCDSSSIGMRTRKALCSNNVCTTRLLPFLHYCLSIVTFRPHILSLYYY